MTWLLPWALVAGGLGMLGVVTAHLLSRQRPRALALATARFLPSGMLEATTLQRVPMDRWWMLLRVLILALLAAGVAQPVFTGSRVPSRTVLLLDRTLPASAQQRALATLAATDVVIAFDSVATLVPRSTVPVVTRSASLSSALGRLVRVRDSLAAGATTTRVHIASRFASRTVDPITESVRALIPDSIHVLPITVPLDALSPRGAVTVHATADDPIAATALLLGDSVASASTIIERGSALTPDDSAAASSGATVLWWPARVATREPALQGVTVGAQTWLAPMERDSSDMAISGRAVGWWADGQVAMRESRIGNGCLLHFRAALPAAGDQSLSLSAQAWLAAVLTSCDVDTHIAVAPAWLSPRPAKRGVVATRAALTSQSAPWLIVAALMLAAAELLLRRLMRT